MWLGDNLWEQASQGGYKASPERPALWYSKQGNSVMIQSSATLMLRLPILFYLEDGTYFYRGKIMETNDEMIVDLLQSPLLPGVCSRASIQELVRYQIWNPYDPISQAFEVLRSSPRNKCLTVSRTKDSMCVMLEGIPNSIGFHIRFDSPKTATVLKSGEVLTGLKVEGLAERMYEELIQL